jgi:hypothetical protein
MLVADNSIEIEVDKRQVCRYVGYDVDDKLPPRISSLIDEYIDNVHYLIEPSYSYVIRDIALVQDSLAVIDGSIIFESQVIAGLLERCHKVALFLVTIGKHLEETACRLAEDGIIVQAAVLDAIGSDAVERMADFVRDRIREAASAQGLVASQRFSPGYCDWDIDQQNTLFQAVDGDALGVHLTETCLMVPRKSISAIIGIGPSNGNMENYNPCKACAKHDCPGRR